MAQLTYISPQVCLEHDTGFGHPERIERLDGINRHLEQCGLMSDLQSLPARPATRADIARVHTPEHIDEVTRLITSGARQLDGDTSVSKRSLEAANLAAGSLLTGIDALASEETKRVFCGVRPPGHHAEAFQAMGFCIYNNVAVAARYAQEIGLASRVLILDWDVHHGNGTQHIFQEDDSVFYYSLHQWPFYPGTGAASETGVGMGKGFTLNRPLQAGSGDDDYLRLVDQDLQHIGNTFKPELIIVSAGFDAHQADPLGAMKLSEECFGRMTRMVTALADDHAQGRVISALEGGYDIQALARSVEVHLRDLAQ